MIEFPALGLIEFLSIPEGIRTLDKMIKSAPISVLKSGTVHNGKFLVLLGGSVASVEEAMNRGLNTAGSQIVDKVFLPEVHSQVKEAIAGKRQTVNGDTLGVIETTTVASVIRITDALLKGTDTALLELRLADDLGGKALTVFSGELEEVQAAVDIAREKIVTIDFWKDDQIIPRIHEDVLKSLNHSTLFGSTGWQKLEEGEI